MLDRFRLEAIKSVQMDMSEKVNAHVESSEDCCLHPLAAATLTVFVESPYHAGCVQCMVRVLVLQNEAY